MSESHDSTHPIDTADLERRRGDAEFRLENVWLDGQRHNLFVIARELDRRDTKLMGLAETETLRVLRDGISLYLVLFDLMAERTGYDVLLEATEDRDEATFKRLQAFLTTWSLYAAASVVAAGLRELVERSPESSGRWEPEAESLDALFGRDRDEALKLLLAEYTALVKRSVSSAADRLETGAAFARLTRTFFLALAERAQKRRAAFGSLTRHVDGESFRAGDMTITGFAHIEMPAAPALEFAPIEAESIVGNDEAKLKLRRSMQRLALYDPAKGRNPVCELGGLAWSVLWDGPPGTGKTSLMRLAMTKLVRYAQQVELGVEFVTVDPTIKDEYYGKTAKNLTERFEKTRNTRGLFLVFFDDIDLLLLPRDAAHISGSDKDVLNLTMQYLDGVYTVARGNGQVYGATNSPLSTESALRQRFHDRVEVPGPQTAEHFADLLALKLDRLASAGLVKLDDGRQRRKTAAESRPRSNGRSGGGSWLDMGERLAGLSVEGERLSGRAVHAISEALKERAADFDIPDELLEAPRAFRLKTWEERLKILADLYSPVTAEMIEQETARYLEAEKRYTEQRERSETERYLDVLIHEYEARRLFDERRTRP